MSAPLLADDEYVLTKPLLRYFIKSGFAFFVVEVIIDLLINLNLRLYIRNLTVERAVAQFEIIQRNGSM